MVYYEARPTRLARLHVYASGLLLMIFAVLLWLIRPNFTSTELIPGLLSVSGLLAWILGFLGFVLAMREEFRRLVTKYTITDMRIQRREGILRKTVQYVLFNKIERIEVAQGIIGRIFNFGDIYLDTGDDHIVLYGIRDPKKVEMGIARTLSTRR